MKYCYKIPEDRICTAKKVLEQNCTVNCENILRRGAPCTFLESKDASYVLLDMGEASVTGYPVFQVSHFQGASNCLFRSSGYHDGRDRTKALRGLRTRQL